MLHAVVPLVPEFRGAYPQITLELDTDELNIDLLQRRTDVAIRIGELRDSTLHARPIATSRLRVLASPAYLAAHGRPKSVANLDRHTLLGFTQPESLNRWPLRGEHGNEWPITPALTASSGETLRQLALEGVGIVCLAGYMTAADTARGNLVQVLARDTVEVRQPISAVYYRNTQLSARITCFLDFIGASSVWKTLHEKYANVENLGNRNVSISGDSGEFSNETPMFHASGAMARTVQVPAIVFRSRHGSSPHHRHRRICRRPGPGR